MLFNETVLSIIQNFIPHETVTFGDRDPPWITSRIKKMNNDKNLAFKHFDNKKTFCKQWYCSLERFSSFQNELRSLIESSKQEYFSKLLKNYLILVSVQKHTSLFFKFFNG